MPAAAPHHTCVCGLGWGDEGKGKVVDLLCPAFDVVVRYNGGANAGHTVRIGDETFALHLLPSGVLHPHVTAVIGAGVVVDPGILLDELARLRDRGVDVSKNLLISARAHLVLPYHKVEDQLSEQSLGGSGQIGTTARGIGPCYADKMRRTTALRVGELVYDSTIESRVHRLVEQRAAQLRAMYGSDGGLNAAAVWAQLAEARDQLAPHIADTEAYLSEQAYAGARVLYEGANGLLLDVNFGTYPFVTSSHPGPHGVAAGAGVPPTWLRRIIGVSKAYATRVGAGPFVTELHDDVGERIRTQGREFGTTTGRPRRCGWFDAVSAGFTARISGVTDLALMHLDTLCGLEQVGICTAYQVRGSEERLTTFPPDVRRMQQCDPVIEYVPGWPEIAPDAQRFEDLPAGAQAYVQRLEELLEVPATIISIGPERGQTIIREPLASALARK